MSAIDSVRTMNDDDDDQQKLKIKFIIMSWTFDFSKMMNEILFGAD